MPARELVAVLCALLVAGEFVNAREYFVSCRCDCLRAGAVRDAVQNVLIRACLVVALQFFGYVAFASAYAFDAVLVGKYLSTVLRAPSLEFLFGRIAVLAH